MGYRSEVAYAIVGEKPDMLAFVATARMTHPELSRALDKCVMSEGDDYYVLGFYAESVKWYKSYEEVHAHMRLLALARENEQLDGIFLRVGEDSNDIEESTFGSNDIYAADFVSLSRAIQVSFETNPASDIRLKLREGVTE